MTQDEFQQQVIKDLVELKTNVRGLVGNGQPGRVKILEDKVESLENSKYWFGGLIVGASTIVSAAFHFLFGK